MDDLDNRLEQLALCAQKYPPGSLERQRYLTRLLSLLTQSPQFSRTIAKSHQDRFGEVYDEALQRLYVYICEKIDSFNPQRSTLIRWAVFLFNHRFINEAKKALNPLTMPSFKGNMLQRLTLDDLEQCRSEPEEISPSEELKNYIQADTDGSLKACALQDRPDITFHTLLLKRLAKCSWKEMSEQLNIPLPTLSSFYRRRLKEFAPKFKADLSL